jgi:hypothetical protein
MRTPNRLILRIGLYQLAPALLILSTSFCYAYYSYGSVRNLLSAVRGQPLIVNSPRQSFGTIKPGEVARVPFRMENVSSSPVRVVGCFVHCSCLLDQQLPFTVMPGETAELLIKVPAVSADSGKEVSYSMELYTNLSTQQRIPLTVQGKVE